MGTVVGRQVLRHMVVRGLSLRWVRLQEIEMLDMAHRVELSVDEHDVTSGQRSWGQVGQRKLHLVWNEELWGFEALNQVHCQAASSRWDCTLYMGSIIH